MEEKRMKVIRDYYMGTAMRKLKSGAAFVELKPNCNTEFVTINKLKDGSKTAKDENVETYRSLIFEIDNEDIELQKRRAKSLFENKVVNRAVFSGSKSVHCRITLNDEPDNKEQYKYIWKKLNEMYFENKADKACSNPARLTRMPNAIRSNGIKQERLYLSNELLNYDWRNEYELDRQIDALIAKQEIEYNQNGKTPIETLLKRNIPNEARKLLENSFTDGERHKEIPKAVAFLKKCGYGLNELELLVRATRIKDSNDYVKNMFNYFK
jgi:hypothetical protein